MRKEEGREIGGKTRGRVRRRDGGRIRAREGREAWHLFDPIQGNPVIAPAIIYPYMDTMQEL